MTFTFFAVLISIVCFFLVVIIMVQNPKGGGLSSTFGGSQQMIGSVQKTNQFLDRATWTMAGAIVVLTFLSSMTLKNNAASSYDELDGAAATEMTVPAVPAATEPSAPSAPAQDTPAE
ncbi:MAG: preprotein translocase subunit SecG [Flavobacteriales bacterium]|nr:preprotein translocase subunit SecG [Flavobacteriales bacterium]